MARSFPAPGSKVERKRMRAGFGGNAMVHICLPSTYPHLVIRACDGQKVAGAAACNRPVAIEEMCPACVTEWPELMAVSEPAPRPVPADLFVELA